VIPGDPSSARSRPAATLAFWRDLLLVGGITVAALHFGQSLLIPLAVALLLFVLLTSLVDRLTAMTIAGRPVPEWLAHVVSIAVILVGLAAILSILASQARLVAEAVPRYEERFTSILADIVSIIGQDNASALSAAIADIDVTGFALNTVNTAGVVLSGLFLVLMYLPFMMLERRPMRTKVAIATPDHELSAEMGRALRSITTGLQTYVGIKTLVSALTGLFSYVVMKAVGLDFAETWGVLAFALNFIPTIGSILGVVFPAIVALVQFETLTPFLIIAVGCGAVQFIIGNFVEPSMTGKSLNLSPMMVILALTLWSSIWGVAGAFLSVPITVCVMIVLSHVPGARWAAVLMSGDGILQRGDESRDVDVEEGQPPEKLASRSSHGPAISGISD